MFDVNNDMLIMVITDKHAVEQPASSKVWLATKLRLETEFYQRSVST